MKTPPRSAKFVCWRVPNSYTAKQVVTSVIVAKESPHDLFITRDGNRLTSAEYVAWFRRCLSAKINSHIRTLNHRGKTYRKLSSQYQTELMRDAARLKGYGGFGKVIATPGIRSRVCDHVHFMTGGRVYKCNDGKQCENRY